ncbi:MAG: hypothetical protein V7L29_01140 [Nostoc sp.]
MSTTTTPTRTAKLCPQQICGKTLNLSYLCIHYDLDIAPRPKSSLEA